MRHPVFRPAQIGSLKLKNRIIMAPMGDYLHEVGQGISEEQVHYFAERAKGGAGLLVQTVYASNVFDHPLTRFDSEDKVFRASYLTKTIHSYGAKMAVMLSLGHGRLFRKETGEPPFSPSEFDVWDTPGMKSVPFTTEQVYSVIEDFKYAASIAVRGGYDAIFIQGYGGYLIDQFMTEKWNQRTDEFGGSFENRMRFPRLLIEAIREVGGKDYPIIFKMTPDHLIEGGRTLSEGLEVAKFLESMGVAAIQIDVGCIDRWYMQIEPSYYEGRVEQFRYAKEIKKVVSIPVFTQGKVGDPKDAFAVFEDGSTDFVALGRPLLADPFWAKKVEAGCEDDIRPCIGCMEGCIGRIDARNTISCAVNPRCGVESSVFIEKAAQPKKVVVVGAGPAGLEAAITCAERGHKVVLFEKEAETGGLANAASGPSFKKDVKRLVHYYKKKLEKYDTICVLCETEATAEKILSERPDAVILANGGKPIVPRIDGVDGENVLSATDVLTGKQEAGKKVAVIGGGYVGCETALFLARQKKEVTLIEMMDEIMPGQSRLELNPMMLDDLIHAEDIKILTSAKLTEVLDGGIRVEKDGKLLDLDVDHVVLALGFKPDNTLEAELEEEVEVWSVGDRNMPRKILNAVWEGFSAGLGL